MRISDWSSDVCSAVLLFGIDRLHRDGEDDLLRITHGLKAEHLEADRRRPGEIGVGEIFRLEPFEPRRKARIARPPPIDLPAVLELELKAELNGTIFARDRKSVGSGKSVSVRVDLGGRRIIKNKKATQTHDKNVRRIS